MKQTAFSISPQELRIRVRNQARPMVGILEATADGIITSTGDPELRYAALHWKTQAIPALGNALFRPDPAAALIDASAFVEQMRIFFVEGHVVRLNEDQLSLLLNAVDQLKARMQGVYVRAGATQAEIDIFWKEIEGWAREHPIQTSFTVRDSSTSLLAQYVTISGGGIGSAVGRLEESMADIVGRIDLLAEFLPRQARWQAQMLIERQLIDGLAERTMAQVGTFPVGIESLPIDITAEREAILADLRREGAIIGAWITGERLESLRYVSAERTHFSRLVTAERVAVIEALQMEREVVLEALRHERAAAFEDLAGIVQNALTSSMVEVVDHLMLRSAQLLAVVVPVVFLGCLFLVWFARRPRIV